MSEKVNRIDIKEFRELGYLQEANPAIFFTRLALALEVIVDEETKEEKLGGIWDYRDDPEGMLFSDEMMTENDAKERAVRIKKEQAAKATIRTKRFGVVIQQFK